MQQFTIATHATGQRRTVKVFIHDSQAEMVEAAVRWNGDPALGEQSAALCQAYDGRHNPQAIVRFCPGWLESNITVHELVHAAQTIYRYDAADIESPAREHFTHYNEEFAHLVSDLFASMLTGLHKAGYEPA